MGTLLLTLSEETTTRSQDVRETNRHIQDQQGPGEVQTEGRRGGQYNQENPGCISCDLCLEIGEAENYVIIETWKDETTCDADTKGAHVEKFLEEMGDAITLDIKKFQVL